jgi:hypothetical protein
MPSARTSVNNKEYDYKGKEKLAAQLQQPDCRQETAAFGVAAVAGALRHETDRKALRAGCQPFCEVVSSVTFLVR